MRASDVYATKARALSRAVNGPVPRRPPPHPLQEWQFLLIGPQRNLYARVPALSMIRPSVGL
jgi:hypothetical protein